jgi:ATP-dependent exoDNAse (exonuclease V) beta subunit
MSNFVVYKSSAGSGKTFTLVKEYLRLALHDEKKLSWSFKRILAVTFTNKAAAEMKQRVISALDKIINTEPLPEPGTLLCIELQIPEEALRERARQLLAAILHNYSDFSIGTIDSFTHKIVKTFAHDLELPVNFNLETDLDGFYDQVISELFSKVGEDPYVTRLLKEYALSRTEENASWDPEKNLLDFVKLLQKENAGYFLEELEKYSPEELERFRQEFFRFTRDYRSWLKQNASKAIELLSENHIPESDVWGGNKGPVNFFHKCLRNEATPEDAEGKRLAQVIEKNNWIAGNVHADHSRISTELSKIANVLIQYIHSNYSHYALCELLARHIYQLMLVKKIGDISRQKKEEEQIVFISEFNHKIFELINNEPTPFIYERLGEKYQHYLLDEFQDTSALQWQNILPLLDNSLANGWFNLVVGDGKQSIYRWRNADVKQFAGLPEVKNTAGSVVVEERARTLKRNFVGKKLDVNYRSTKTIIEFNNSLFDHLCPRILLPEYAGIYSEQAQQIRSQHAGYVSIHTGKVEKDELDDFHCSTIKKHIDSAIEDGFSLRDICVICRTNIHGNLIASFLASQKIPVVSSDSLLLKNNPEVHTIVCFLNYLENPDDHVSAAAVLNYLSMSGKIPATAISEALKKLKSQNLFSILAGYNISLYKNEFPLRNIFDNCIRVAQTLGLCEANHLYMRFFLDEVNEFLVTKNSNLGNFLQWWETRQNKASVILPESSNAVKIMTIHASKGLEFPVVIAPYCNWQLYKPGNAWVKLSSEKAGLSVAVVSLSEKVREAGLETELDQEKQEQALDNLNLLYVTFTRAVNRLHVIATASESNKQKTVGNWLEDYLEETKGKNNFFEFGEKTGPLEERKKSYSQLSLSPVSFKASDSNVKIKSSWLKDNDEIEKAKRQGITMHWILSRILTKSDIASALEAALIQGLIRREEVDETGNKIVKLLDHPLLSPHYTSSTQSRLEHELITADGEILRPDKIVAAGEQCVIIDYKTGAENNKKYLPQMQKYENAMRDLGLKNITKILAYIDLGETLIV